MARPLTDPAPGASPVAPDDTTRPPIDPGVLRSRVLDWYDSHARDLPWRAPEATPWQILVSEVMLQQTPVARVLPAWEAWVVRWPTPGALAGDPAGEAVRAWGRLGYPRRALRLHAAATAMVDRHGGKVPRGYADLLALPGVGEYTAAAVASFAFGDRQVVLDTNVRRVLARACGGQELAPPAPTRGERARAELLLPHDGPTAAAWAVAVMELGALVCGARTQRCTACPIVDLCAWRAAGAPPDDGPARRAQGYAGTDRQCRGRLLGVVREAESPVPRSRLDTVWPPAAQRRRCLDSLVADGLLVRAAPDAYALP